MTKTNAAVVDDESPRPNMVEETLFLDGDANFPVAVAVDHNHNVVGPLPLSSCCFWQKQKEDKDSWFWFPNTITNKCRILISITLTIVGCLIAGIVIMSNGNGNAVESTLALSIVDKISTNTKSGKRSKTTLSLSPSLQPSGSCPNVLTGSWYAVGQGQGHCTSGDGYEYCFIRFPFTSPDECVRLCECIGSHSLTLRGIEVEDSNRFLCDVDPSQQDIVIAAGQSCYNGFGIKNDGLASGPVVGIGTVFDNRVFCCYVKKDAATNLN